MKLIWLTTIFIFFSLCLHPKNTNAQITIDVEVIKTSNFSINGKGTSDRWQNDYFGGHCATHFGHVVPPVSGVIVPFLAYDLPVFRSPLCHFP